MKKKTRHHLGWDNNKPIREEQEERKPKIFWLTKPYEK